MKKQSVGKKLFFHPRNDYTGSTRVLANIIEAEYVDQQVFVVVNNIKEGFLSQLSNVKIIPIYYPLYKGNRIFLITPILWRIHAFYLAFKYSFKVDTFYINTIVPYYAAIVGAIRRKKIIYHIHEKFVVKNCYTKVSEWVFNHTTATRIFVSKYLEEQYPIRKGCPSIVKYNTLPKSFLDKVNVVSIEERHRNTIIMIASLSKVKGLFTYVDVARKMPDYRFVLILSANKEKIENFFVETLPNNLTIYPSQSDIHPFLQKADLMLNLSIPSLWIETFGMTILEAMAYGIPSIVPNVGGPTELIIDGYNGYCIDVTDVDEVIFTIKRALMEENYMCLMKNSLKRFLCFL